MGKPMVVIMELIALMVFQVQGNDLIISSLCTSSLPNCLLHPSQLDVNGCIGKLNWCLRKEPGKCNKEHGTESLELKDRVIYNFFQCPYKLQSLVEGSDIKVYARVKKCMNLCFPKLEELSINNYRTCLFNYYEKRINKKDWNLVLYRINELRGLVKKTSSLLCYLIYKLSLSNSFNLYW